MSPMKGTPSYWKKVLHEVLAMVEQLSSPTFFLTLSCADLRWQELVSISSKLNLLDYSNEFIKNMTYQEIYCFGWPVGKDKLLWNPC